MSEKGNVLFLGQPGLGKTHLVIAPGYAAWLQGHRVLFANTLSAAQCPQPRLKAELKKYLSPQLLVIDELGYPPIDQNGADYRIPLDPHGRMALDLGGTIGWVDENRILEEEQFYYGVSATLPYRLNDVTTVGVGGHLDGRFDGDDQAGRSTSREFLYWAASVNMAF